MRVSQDFTHHSSSLLQCAIPTVGEFNIPADPCNVECPGIRANLCHCAHDRAQLLGHVATRLAYSFIAVVVLIGSNILIVLIVDVHIVLIIFLARVITKVLDTIDIVRVVSSAASDEGGWGELSDKLDRGLDGGSSAADWGSMSHMNWK